MLSSFRIQWSETNCRFICRVLCTHVPLTIIIVHLVSREWKKLRAVPSRNRKTGRRELNEAGLLYERGTCVEKKCRTREKKAGGILKLKLFVIISSIETGLQENFYIGYWRCNWKSRIWCYYCMERMLIEEIYNLFQQYVCVCWCAQH